MANPNPRKVKSAGGLRVRLAPGTSGDIVGMLPNGASVELVAGDPVDKDKLRWVPVQLWVAEKFLEMPATSPPGGSPSSPSSPSSPGGSTPGPGGPVVARPLPPLEMRSRAERFGIHVIGWVPEAIDLAVKLRAAGRPLGGAVVVDEPKMVRALKEVSPSTLIVYRSTAMPDFIPILEPSPSVLDGYAAGRARFAQWWPILRDGQADVYSFGNEWLSPSDAGLLAAGCGAYIGLMDCANEAGIKITVGDFSSGHPQVERADIRLAMQRMLAQAERDRHFLNVHIYAASGRNLRFDPPNYGRRWTRIAVGFPNLAVIAGEVGFTDRDAAFAGVDPFVGLMADCLDLAGGDARFTFAAGWTLTQHVWAHSSFAPALERLVAGV